MAPWLATLSLVASANATYEGATGTVYVIRHGEKTWAAGCLNEQGNGRANHLPEVFSGKPSTEHDVFTKPKALFAHKYGDVVNCERTEQTIQPTADALHLTIDHTHGGSQPGLGWGGGNQGAADAMLAALFKTGGPVLAAWEHINIQYLTQDLGVAPEDIPDWPNSEFDRIYVVEYVDGAVKKFHHAQQNFKFEPYNGVWEVKHPGTCWPGIERSHCKGTTMEECKGECAADPGCGGFTWPHGHTKGHSCPPSASLDNQTLYYKDNNMQDVLV